MADNPRCCVQVATGTYPGLIGCSHAAKVQSDGKWYCGIHDPEKIKQRAAKRNAKWAEDHGLSERRWCIAKLKEEVVEAAKASAGATNRAWIPLLEMKVLELITAEKECEP